MLAGLIVSALPALASLRSALSRSRPRPMPRESFLAMALGNLNDYVEVIWRLSRSSEGDRASLRPEFFYI